MKYNYVYKTTNLINGKIYIGVRCTNKLKDGYIGCGVYSQDSADKRSKKGHKGFVKAVAKYGYGNFKKEILYYFKTAEEAYNVERQLVNEDFVLKNNNYNISIGGKSTRTVSKYKKYKIIWENLYKNGYTMKKIAGMYNTSHSQVSITISNTFKKDNYRSTTSKCIEIKCLNTNKTYPSINKAAMDIYGKRCNHSIKKVLDGKKDNFKGYRFCYV